MSKQSFYFPLYELSFEAETQEEAIKLLEETLKSKEEKPKQEKKPAKEEILSTKPNNI